MMDMSILSWLIWLPIGGGIALLVLDALGNTACRQQIYSLVDLQSINDLFRTRPFADNGFNTL